MLASISDIRGMTISNSYSLFVVGAFTVAFVSLYLGGLSGQLGPLWSHLASAGIFFVVTFVLFAVGALGAADSKLGAAYALWFPLSDLPLYLFFMAFVGGVLGVAALLFKRLKPFKNAPEGSWMAQVQDGASKVPYGVAIAVGMLFAFYAGGYFDSAFLFSFVSLKEGAGGL